MNKHIKTFKTVMLGTVLATSVSACSLIGNTADRLSSVGAPPEMTKITNPTTQADYQPVSLPMPTPRLLERNPNSLWQAGRQKFFKDQRASAVGDILTVRIDIDDEAELSNESERTRSSEENAGLDAGLGYEASLNRLLPEAIDPTNLIDLDSDSTSSGSGSVEREEEIELQVAALVTQILPNGNMVIQGRQEVRVNFENRILEIMGIIRPEDITVDNTISHDKIAEARISYGGEGHITDVQQPRYGQQVYDILFPF